MVTPWRSIFTSVPLLAICVSHCGIIYGFLTLLLETPMYLKEVHGIDMKQVLILIALIILLEYFRNSKIEDDAYCCYVAQNAWKTVIVAIRDFIKMNSTSLERLTFKVFTGIWYTCYLYQDQRSYS